jgi:hypothetical protein
MILGVMLLLLVLPVNSPFAANTLVGKKMTHRLTDKRRVSKSFL